jgi:hypothetical protein
MEKSTKRTLNSIILFLTSFIYFFLAHIGFKKQNLSLANYESITSVIIDKGIDYRHGSKGHDSKCFYIQLRDSEKKLGVYRITKNYSDLLDKFMIGDTVTAYYRDNNNRHENINIDLVQVEKGKQILLDKKEYKRKESSLIFIGLIAGVLTIAFSYLYYKRKILPNAT